MKQKNSITILEIFESNNLPTISIVETENTCWPLGKEIFESNNLPTNSILEAENKSWLLLP